MGRNQGTEATKGSKRLVSTTGFLIKGSLLTKPYCFSYRNHCTHRLLSFLGASTTLTSTWKSSTAAWLSRDLMVKLKGKKQIHRPLKIGLTADLGRARQSWT